MTYRRGLAIASLCAVLAAPHGSRAAPPCDGGSCGASVELAAMATAGWGRAERTYRSYDTGAIGGDVGTALTRGSALELAIGGRLRAPWLLMGGYLRVGLSLQPGAFDSDRDTSVHALVGPWLELARGDGAYLRMSAGVGVEPADGDGPDTGVAAGFGAGYRVGSAAAWRAGVRLEANARTTAGSLDGDHTNWSYDRVAFDLALVATFTHR